MAFLPDGSIPYQQFVRNSSYSLSCYLGNKGYKSFVTHPYYSSGWNRTNVYSNFGFDSYYFINSYPQQNRVRQYVSDQEMYEWIIDKYENNIKEKEKRRNIDKRMCHKFGFKETVIN